LSAPIAILRSLKYAGQSVVAWTNLEQVGCLLLLIPLFYLLVKKTNFKFKYPLIVVIVIFGFFAAQATPPLYAMSSVGGYRQINMYYYSYYWLIAISTLYVEGWVVHKFSSNKILSTLKTPLVSKVYILLAFCMIFIGSLLYGLKDISFYETYLDLKSGRAQRYDREYKQIIAQLESSEGIVYTTDINEWPNSFYRLQLNKKDDIGYWINNAMAAYYGLDEINLAE